MATRLRVGSLNLRAYPNPGRDQIRRLASIVADQRCDVLLLQECLKPWLEVACGETGMVGVHSHSLPPETPAREFSPDGCAIALRGPAVIRRAWRIAPESFLPNAVQREIPEKPPDGFRPMPQRLSYRYSGRSILAEVAIDGERLVVGSFHATPGTGTVGGVEVGEWKPFFHGAVALELKRLRSPFVFSIDANEPYAETVESITFHWEEGRSGAQKLQALLGLNPIHRGRDLFRERLREKGRVAASPEVLLPTYAPSADFQRRFDSMWATPELRLVDFATELDRVVEAGGDHAMLVADLQLG